MQIDRMSKFERLFEVIQEAPITISGNAKIDMEKIKDCFLFEDKLICTGSQYRLCFGDTSANINSNDAQEIIRICKLTQTDESVITYRKLK